MVNLDWQVASVIVPSELSWLDDPLCIGTSLLLDGLPCFLSFIPGDGITAGALTTDDELVNSTGGLGVLVSNLLHPGSLLFGKVIFGEVTECRVWVFWCIAVVPWLVVDVFGLQ